MQIHGELLTIAQDQTRTHISHAIELMRFSYAVVHGGDGSSFYQPRSKKDASSRLSVSAILHALAALESQLNLLYYEFFINPQSINYVPTSKRDTKINGAIKTDSWRKKGVVAKFNFFVRTRTGVNAPDSIINQLDELCRLRNFLIHGTLNRRTLLVEGFKFNQSFTPLDIEDSFDTAKEFPICQFSQLDCIDYNDSQKAIRISLSALKYLDGLFTRPVSLAMAWGDPLYKTLYRDAFDIDKAVSLT